jgi:RNA polymerase sigma-70 factor (ECF subfamily)
LAHPPPFKEERSVDEQELPPQIDSAILKLTRLKSRYLVGKYGFGRHDAEDIQHELLLDYLKRSGSFDTSHFRRETFVRLVINHRIATIIEAQRAACRDYRVCWVSLDQPTGHRERNSLKLIDVMEDNASPFRQFESSLNLSLEVERVLRKLPADLRHLCRMLMQSENCAEAATMAGISRATLYRRIQWIREAFTRAGFQCYLGHRR